MSGGEKGIVVTDFGVNSGDGSDGNGSGGGNKCTDDTVNGEYARRYASNDNDAADDDDNDDGGSATGGGGGGLDTDDLSIFNSMLKLPTEPPRLLSSGSADDAPESLGDPVR